MSLFLTGQELEADDLNNAFEIVRRKGSDETVNNSATLQDDNDLVWTLEASATYVISIYLSYNSGATPDIKFGWTVPTSSTLRWGFIGVDTALALKAGAASVLNSGSVEPFGGDAAERYLQIHGSIVTSTTAGSLILRWAQNTANASNTIVRSGSWGIVRKMA